MSSNGEEEETGPSVDSNDQEERIAARRIRIQKRLETQRRAQMGEDPSEKREVKEEVSKSRAQMEESRLRLTKLLSDGSDLVSNIRVASDAREAARRVEEEENKRHRKERLEAEARVGTEKFDEITRKWESSLQKEIPQDLHVMLSQQKQSCDAMIEEKNKLITDFQMELKQKDDAYVKDLKKMAEDIDLMIERMDEQVKQLTKAYRDELTQVEKSFVAERTELLEHQHKKWGGGMEQRTDKEKDFMSAREQRVEDFDQQLQHLRTQDAEEYNMVKIKLETNVQILEQQLQQMRATYQLNQEKLDYNFQVLRKRDEENTITKSQQKRKITRLQDVLTNLKVKLAKKEKTYREENQQLTEDYKRIQEQFRELQKKSKHFIATDICKFRDVWIMNEEEAKALVQKTMEEDRIIHEQQLGLPWEPVDLEFMDNVGPILSQRAKRRAVSAQQVVSEVMSATGQAPTDQEPEEKEESAPAAAAQSLRTSILDKLLPSTVKSILELLCDESGFLIENKLQKLLTPLERDEQSLMKLDAIFSALGIDTEDDIHLLAGYFLAMQEDAEKAALSTTEGDLENTTQESTAEESEDAPAAVSSKKLIHPNEVMKALRMFVEDNKQPPKDKGRGAQFQLTGLEERDDSDDAAYWAGYPDVLTEDKEKLWDALIEGTDKYSEILSSRAGLIKETEGLRQQNAELRMLLHQYVNSKVNQELEIPPTKVLQLDSGMR